jgi:serine/threonine protein kinase
MRDAAPNRLGRYEIHGVIAKGGMAQVHLGRLVGGDGFTRTVAIKRMHAHLVGDAEFTAMFRDEARLAARVRHPNVVPTFDVVAESDELAVIMEYVLGESVAQLIALAGTSGEPIPPAIAAAVMCGALHGLHAAHEAVDERGEPLGIIHRDVSPQNILLGADGIARIFDFGIARARGRSTMTQEGTLKGKLGYMAPEQLRGEAVDRRTDIYAAGVVLWEMLAGRRLFVGDNEGAIIEQILLGEVDPPSERAPGISRELDRLIFSAISRDRRKRFATALAMASALESRVEIASPTRVAEWVKSVAADELRVRGEELGRVERGESVVTRVRELATPSEVSSTLSASVSEARPSRFGRWALLAGATLLVGLGAYEAGQAAGSAPLPPASSPIDDPEHRAEPSSASPPQAEASASTQPVESPGPSSRPAASPARVPSAATRSAPRPRKPGPVSPNASTPPSGECSPPYTVDEQGVRHYKPACPLD